MSPIRPLASGFPAYSEDDWRAVAEKPRAEDRDPHGIGNAGRALAPSGRGARPVVGRPPGKPWRIVERIDSGDATEAVGLAMIATAGGATGLDLVLPASVHPLARCIDSDPASLAEALARIPHRVHLRIDAGAPLPAVIDPFLALARTHTCELVWGFDPVISAAIHGGRSAYDAAMLRSALGAFDAQGIAGQLLVADGRLWHAGGATDEQELGIALATYASHVRALGSTDRIGIALAVDSDQFRSIAKLRAMRLLIARLIEVAGLAPPPLKIHAETAWRSLSVRDPDMNILRATAAAFAAVVGGADTIAVLPFDIAPTANGGAAPRLGRNLQIILADEAHLGRVADPGAGSDVIESLTSSFAEAAWKRFQSIEAEGGILAAIADGALLREVAEAREARLARVARADIKLVGVNAFRGDAAIATVKRTPVKRTGPLTFKRLSSPFEDAS